MDLSASNNTIHEPSAPLGGRLSASLEDYLEAIYWLSRKHGVARASQIADKVNVGKSSVTAALKLLADKGHVNYDPYQLISLTESGEAIAKDVVLRHDVLKRFLMEVLDVDEERAGKSACGMEHSVDPEVLDRLLKFVQIFDKCRQDNRLWSEIFHTLCEHGKPKSLCRTCSANSLQNNNVANEGINR
jgi:DtxR family Mn-dependent transcriptional regulator